MLGMMTAEWRKQWISLALVPKIRMVKGQKNCLLSGLIIGGPLFPDNVMHKITWHFPDGMTALDGEGALKLSTAILEQFHLLMKACKYIISAS